MLIWMAKLFVPYCWGLIYITGIYICWNRIRN